jgi:hypothetical protein
MMKPISSYVNDNGITITVYPEKKVKRNPYSWGGSIALLGGIAKRGIPTEGCMFTPVTRRKYK